MLAVVLIVLWIVVLLWLERLRLTRCEPVLVLEAPNPHAARRLWSVLRQSRPQGWPRSQAVVRAWLSRGAREVPALAPVLERLPRATLTTLAWVRSLEPELGSSYAPAPVLRILWLPPIAGRVWADGTEEGCRSGLRTLDRLRRALEQSVPWVYWVIDRGRGGERRLLSLPTPGEVAVVVEVVCPSTGEVYYLRVPPDVRTCHEAVAWTFGLEPERYAPILET